MSFAPGGSDDDFFGPDWRDDAVDAGWFDPEDYSQGAIDIMKERERQEVEEGWTPTHDDAYVDGQLPKAAACYAWLASLRPEAAELFVDHPPPVWPDWHLSFWRPKDARSNLVRAGALIAAEIDRLDRASKPIPNDGGESE